MTYAHLQPSINLGLDEEKFWNMTLAEVGRYIDGAIWRMQQKAQFDYALANLCGLSSARMMSSEVTFPTIEEAYPNLFKKEEVTVEVQEDIATQNSINRFMQFAMKHNNNMKRKEEGDQK